VLQASSRAAGDDAEAGALLGLVVSMWVGNLMLLVLNLPLVGIWVRLLSIPYRILFPAILMFCCVGVYLINNHPIEVSMAGAFGIGGVPAHEGGLRARPAAAGLRPRTMMEENLRRSLFTRRAMRASSSPGDQPRAAADPRPPHSPITDARPPPRRRRTD